MFKRFIYDLWCHFLGVFCIIRRKHHGELVPIGTLGRKGFRSITPVYQCRLCAALWIPREIAQKQNLVKKK